MSGKTTTSDKLKKKRQTWLATQALTLAEVVTWLAWNGRRNTSVGAINANGRINRTFKLTQENER